MRYRLLVRVSVIALMGATPCWAEDAAPSQNDLLAKIEKQDAEIAALKQQLQALTSLVEAKVGTPKPAAASRRAEAAPVVKPSPSVETRLSELETRVQAQDEALAARQQPTGSTSLNAGTLVMNGAQPRFESADGAYSAALRTLVDFDSAYYIQDNQPSGGSGQDLSSGTNFRRARFGIEGTIARNFDYSFIYEFGGTGVEGAGQIQQAYLQFSALRPLYLRAGAYAPSANIEDATGAGDTLFLERASVSEITRGLAGADGRSAAGVIYAPERYFLSAAYTGAKVGQSSVFDEQQGSVGRAAALVYTNEHANVLLGVNGSYVWDLPDTTAGPGSATNVSFGDRPELRVDGTQLVSTGSIDARSAYHYGFDAGANYDNLYLEGGYFRFGADRRGTSDDPDFSGYYVQASWVLTGEPRRYNQASASWKVPKVASPFTGTAGSGWGAWELAARYSTVDLNYNPGTAGAPVPATGIRGGEQDIWSAALNWYANSAIRIAFEYQAVSIDRLNGTTTPPPANAQIGQDYQTLSARVQVGF